MQGSHASSPPPRQSPAHGRRPALSSLILVGFALIITIVFVVGGLIQNRFILDIVRDLAIVF
jgi:hypothetical protein